MTVTLNETHDPARRSFVESANTADCDFPIQNLPFGIFRPRPGEQPRGGIAIGDQILDVAAAAASFDGAAADAAKACAAPHLNRLMALGPQASSALRLAVSRALECRARRAREARGASRTDGAGGAAFAGVDRRLHRFLRVGVSCHQRGPRVPAGQSAAAELQICAGGVSRPRLVRPRQRHAVPAAAGPAKARGSGRADVWPGAQHGFRTRAWHVRRHADRIGRNGSGWQGGGAHFRLLSP